MFYSHSMLSRKGPLATIWLAAYCYHKLKRSQIATTDIASSVDKILPEADVSYRIVAHLLLGVVRIYSRKVDFLYHDCNEALSRVQRSLVETLRRETLRTHPTAAAAVAAVVVAVTETRHVKRTRPALPPTDATPTATAGAEEEEEERAAAAAAKHAKTSRGLRSEHRKLLLSPPECPMIAPYREGVIIIPETFELDSFNLELPEERDDDNNHHLLQLEDEQEDTKRSYLIQNRTVDQPDTSFNYACFTPVADTVFQDVIDVELEIDGSTGNGASTVPGTAEDQQGGLSLVSTLPAEEGSTAAFPRAKKSLTINIHADEYIPMHQDDDVTEVPPKSGRQETHDKAKPSKPSVSGQPTSPQFTVATPAKEEGHHFLRKRKRHQTPFDEEAIVLSNEALRKGLDDPSDTVKKRGKAPHTRLDIWKAYKFSDIDRAFVDPLICYNYLEIKDIQIRRSLRASSLKTTALNSKIPSSTTSPFKKVRRTAKRKLVPASVSGSETATVSDHTLPDVPPSESGGETNGDASVDVHADVADVHEVNAAGAYAKAPVVKAMDTASPKTLLEKTTDSVESPVDDRLYGASGETPANGELGRSSGEAFADKILDDSRPEVPSEGVLSDVETDTENGSGSESFDRNGLSVKTRLVAKNLHKAFTNTRFQEQGGGLSLTKVLDGKKRAACARFFYETLVLTTLGHMEVKQESPYGDIIILASSEWTFKANCRPFSILTGVGGSGKSPC